MWQVETDASLSVPQETKQPQDPVSPLHADWHSVSREPTQGNLGPRPRCTHLWPQRAQVAHRVTLNFQRTQRSSSAVLTTALSVFPSTQRPRWNTAPPPVVRAAPRVHRYSDTPQMQLHFLWVSLIQKQTSGSFLKTTPVCVKCHWSFSHCVILDNIFYNPLWVLSHKRSKSWDCCRLTITFKGQSTCTHVCGQVYNVQ